MIISKVLNNNVVISEENHQEVVLMGRGLAFGCKAGDDIQDNLMEKKYVLSEKQACLLISLKWLMKLVMRIDEQMYLTIYLSRMKRKINGN